MQIVFQIECIFNRLQDGIDITFICTGKPKNSCGLPYQGVSLVAFNCKESACQCRRRGFDPWVQNIPQRRKWQCTPVLLPGKSYEQRSLVGYSPWGCQESGRTQWLNNNNYLIELFNILWWPSTKPAISSDCACILSDRYVQLSLCILYFSKK